MAHKVSRFCMRAIVQLPVLRNFLDNELRERTADYAAQQASLQTYQSIGMGFDALVQGWRTRVNCAPN